MTTIALIDYGSGNLHSAERALRVAATEAGQAHQVQITSDPELIARADRIVLPGVGHFADCAVNLRTADRVIEALTEAVQARGVPFLGICVGQQLLATTGLEDGETPGLNWLPGRVDKITPGEGYRIPHMGWNQLEITRSHPVLADLGNDPHVYFTHSYAYRDAARADIAATATYGQPIIAAVARENIFGTQFHPEKSQRVGLKILANFIAWKPS